MRYSCRVCGMNHSRPCDLGFACGIYEGLPALTRTPSRGVRFWQGTWLRRLLLGDPAQSNKQ